MKKILLLVLFTFLIVFTHNAYPIEISQHMTGSWYNPQQSGHGLSVEILSAERSIFYWYVYNPDGTPTFLVADGQNSGDTITATLYHFTGMRWGEFNPAENNQTVWGTATIKFSDCFHALMRWEASHGQRDIPFGDGVVELVKLAEINYTQCSDNRYAGIYKGVIYDDEDDDDYEITMLLSHDMRAVMFAEDEVASFGHYSTLGNRITLTDMATYSVDPMDPYTFMLGGFGPIAPEYGSYIMFSGVGLTDDVEGEFIAPDSLYRRGVAFDIFIGAQVAEDLVTGETGWADLWPNGHVTGELDQVSGCRFEGDLVIPDARFNLFDVTLTVTNCGTRNGLYTGMGYQADAHEIQDGAGLYIIASNGQQPFVLWLEAWW